MNIKEEIVKRVQTLNLPEAEQLPAVEFIRVNLLQRIGVRIAEDAPEETLTEFSRLLDINESDALEYLDSKLPNFHLMVLEELDILVEEYALMS